MGDVSTIRELTQQYHAKYHPDMPEATPTTIPASLLRFRKMLDDSETVEVAEEWPGVLDVANSDRSTEAFHEDAVETIGRLLHELADRCIVAYGTASYVGVDLDEVIRAVMDANMRKVPNPCPGGKALKPIGFVSAELAVRRIVERACLPPLPPKWSQPADVSRDLFAPASVAPRDDDEPGPEFTAVYDTDCPGCGNSCEDETCRMYRGEAWHMWCVDEELSV